MVWCGGRYCFAPTPHLFPRVSISQVWKVLGLGLCHSVDTEIRAEGTQRTKSVWSLGPRLGGCSQVPQEQVAATSCPHPAPSQRKSGTSTPWTKGPD